MITNEQAREWILQKLYDEGYRFVARNKRGSAVAYDAVPDKTGACWGNSRVLYIQEIFDLFDDVQWEDDEPLDIAKELGIVDWSKVPVDTKVVVSNDKLVWRRRYFSRYGKAIEKPFICFANGNTSWSSIDEDLKYRGWKYCELVDE